MRTGENVRLRTDGRFEARYVRSRDERGRIVYGCCYGRTREEALRKREEALCRLNPVREMNLLILGAKGSGETLREIAQSLGVFKKIAFLDDDPAETQAIGRCEDMAQFVERYPAAISSAADWPLRKRQMEMLAQAGFILPSLFHPSAAVSRDAQIGYGTVVEARAIVGSGAVIGNGCVISAGAVVGRRSLVRDGCYVAYNTAVPPDTVLSEGLRVEFGGAHNRPGCAEEPPYGGEEAYYFEAGV